MALHYRQGDILLLKVSSIPKIAKKQQTGMAVVLALGERTGHKHVLEGRRISSYAQGSTRFLDVHEGAYLRHDEHAEVPIHEGLYRLVLQRQYSDADEVVIEPKPIYKEYPATDWRHGLSEEEIDRAYEQMYMD